MTYTKKTDLVIYETNDYEKFKLLGLNRPLTDNHSLEQVIKENNLLKYNAMIVTPDFEVLDGQHRLEICKKLGMPIFYIINFRYHL